MLIVTELLQKVNAELSKVKLHAKSKIASLTAQLNQSKKSAADAAEPVCCSYITEFIKLFLPVRAVLYAIFQWQAIES